ncbi:MAG TPA: hypothetical protein VHT73_15400 [Thermodesulfobacteriota bacterium]|nr:hypothetical protein [Thermodesulfobacteriota bacterium]
MTKEFSEIEWLEKYVGKSIDVPSLENIRNFSLFWNIFESTVCGKRATVKSICSKVDSLIKKESLILKIIRNFMATLRIVMLNQGK